MMKTTHLFKLFLLCLSFGLVACSSDDSSDGGDPEPPISEGNFTKRVLIEDYTGTWCGNCPNVAHAIEMAKEETDKVVAVGIHRESSDPSSPNYDPFNYEAATELENALGIGGAYPWAMLDRTIRWTYPAPNHVSEAVDLAGDDASIGLAINSSLNNNTLQVTVETKFGSDFTSQNLSLVVYVLESDLIYDQVNYTSYYGGEGVLVNFEYDHVLRSTLTDILGDAIPSEETALGNTYTASYSVPVSETNVSEASNIKIVAFVTNSEGTVLNVREADIGDSQTFQEN